MRLKKRTESAKIYRDNGRPELAEPEEREIEVLKVYLPTQLTEDELTTLVEQKIAELDVSGSQAIGQVIGAIKAEVGNKADSATLANIVKNTLSK